MSLGDTTSIINTGSHSQSISPIMDTCSHTFSRFKNERKYDKCVTEHTHTLSLTWEVSS